MYQLPKAKINNNMKTLENDDSDASQPRSTKRMG